MKKIYTCFNFKLKSLTIVATLNISLVILIFMISSCTMLFIPKKQKITFITQNDSSVVYVNSEEFGKGKTVTGKIKKKGMLPIVVQTPGFKDLNTVLVPKRKAHAFWPLVTLDALTAWGLMIVKISESDIKANVYNKIHIFPTQEKLIKRLPNQKYIDIDAIKLNINDINKDIRQYDIYEGQDIEKEIEKVNIRIDKEISKENKKKKGKKQLVTEEKEIKSDDTKYTMNIYKTLNKSLFIDTINKVFNDVNNTLLIEGLINQGNVISVSKKQYSYYKARINILWYIKNFYGEKIDSINNISYSGDYISNSYYVSDEIRQKMFAEAVDKSFSSVLKSDKMTRHLLVDSNMNINDAVLSIKKPKNLVTSTDDASKACVIIKRKDNGHGSGFAISNDGYILTNFHVVAGDIAGKLSPITVILENGEEVEAQVVRYNAMRDIALIKVNKTFENAFLLNSEKTFKRLMDVYTIGTPKSIELGQTISSGIVSNERKANNNDLIQLNMSVNAGNSGGPLFDKSGILHGVIKSKLIGFATEGVSFAIPSNKIAEYLNLVLVQ